MIEGNKIKLGAGDVLVEVGNKCITLKQFQLDDAGFKTYGDIITINFDFYEYHEFLNKTKRVNIYKENIFEFKGYIFEFDLDSSVISACLKNLHDAIYIAWRYDINYFAC